MSWHKESKSGHCTGETHSSNSWRDTYAKVFSKLDLNMASHQIKLHPDSRDITTFAAPDDLYRYKRLLFGVNLATEKF